MMKNPIGWIDIPVVDIARAEQWYHSYFGFEFTRQTEHDGHIMSWFPMDMESYGSAACLMQGCNYVPATDRNGVLIYFTAPAGSITDSIIKATELGIEVLIPHYPLGEHGHMAVLRDSEGNRIAIHSMTA